MITPEAPRGLQSERGRGTQISIGKIVITINISEGQTLAKG